MKMKVGVGRTTVGIPGTSAAISAEPAASDTNRATRYILAICEPRSWKSDLLDRSS